MDGVPSAGTPVTVVLRGNKPAQWPGRVAAVRDGGIAVQLAGEMPSWDATAQYVLVAVDGDVRLTQRVTYIGHTERAVAFRSQGGWQRMDRRSYPRYRADFRVEVRSVLGGSRQDGRLVDISMGGLAVRTESRPGGRQVQVRIWAGAFSSELLCTVLRADEQDNCVVLRLQYVELLPSQRAFVRQVIDGLSQASREQAS